jgi:hypothetical protein
MTKNNIQTVKQFVHDNEAFTEGGIRNLIFNAKTNGFSSAFLRIGRKVLIDVDEFFRCIKAQN